MSKEIKITKAEWRSDDGFGITKQMLYIGKLFVGAIVDLGGGHEQVSGDATRRWRGSFMSDELGEDTGWFATAEEARKSVEDALNKALSKG